MKKFQVLCLSLLASFSALASIQQGPTDGRRLPLLEDANCIAASCKAVVAIDANTENGAVLKYTMSQSNLVEKYGYDAQVLDQEVEETTQVISAYFKKNPQFKGMLILSTAYLPSYGKPQVLKMESFQGFPYAAQLQSQFKDIEKHIKCNETKFCNLWLQMSANFKAEPGTESEPFDAKDFSAFFAEQDMKQHDVYPSKKVKAQGPEFVFFVYEVNGHKVSQDEANAFFQKRQ